MHGAANILPVILAGGEGKRLAPIASPSRPKPFIPLPDGQSLFTKTCLRIKDARAFLPPLVVGQQSHRFALLNHAREAELPPAAMLLEPKVCNTTMAVAVAVCWAMQHRPEAVLAILPADHLLEPVADWQTAVTAAALHAKAHGNIALLAITPTHPSAEYGYMACLPKGAYEEVAQFIEKPDKPESLIVAQERRWAWNAGQFIAPVAVLEHALATHASAYLRAAQQAWAGSRKAWEFTELATEPYTDLAPLAFDRAVLEKTRALAIRYFGSWRDMGRVNDWETYTKMPLSAFINAPPRIDRPWGYYEIIATANNYVEKRLTIYPNCRLSLQRHHLRREHWQVITGTAHIELNQTRVILQTGDRIEVPESCWHRLSNNSSNKLIIKEIQRGFPDENDIERIDDDYGRI